MKISPIAHSGATLGNVDIGRSVSPGKLERAKAVFAGEEPPEKTSGDPQADRIQSVRKIKMKTNANPTELDYPPAEAAVAESTIADTSEPAAEAIEDTKPLSPQFAALAKQRRALQIERKAFEEEKKALAQNPQDAGKDWKSELKLKPLKVLQEAGVTYDQLTEAILSEQGGSAELHELRQEIKALKEGVDQKLTDRDTQAEQAALAEMEREALHLVKDGEAFEMVRETKSIPEVMKLIHRTYKEKGEVLDVSEALQLVEDDLINESLKIAAIKKVQNRLVPSAAPSQTQSSNQSRPLRTLTNRDAASAPMSKKQRALAAFKGQLK